MGLQAHLFQMKNRSIGSFEERFICGIVAFEIGGDGMEETRLNVLVPADLARRFKAACALRGMSQKQVLIQLMERWLENEGPNS